jgi:hypothetical protein
MTQSSILIPEFLDSVRLILLTRGDKRTTSWYAT